MTVALAEDVRTNHIFFSGGRGGRGREEGLEGEKGGEGGTSADETHEFNSLEARIALPHKGR